MHIYIYIYIYLYIYMYICIYIYIGSNRNFVHTQPIELCFLLFCCRGVNSRAPSRSRAYRAIHRYRSNLDFKLCACRAIYIDLLYFKLTERCFHLYKFCPNPRHSPVFPPLFCCRAANLQDPLKFRAFQDPSASQHRCGDNIYIHIYICIYM